MRADVFLVDSGQATTRSQAQRLIAAGVQWRLAPTLPWNAVAKNGDDIPAGAQVQLLDASEAKYLSRGGLKLEGALAASGLAVQGLRCLDVGQSTGGFADFLREHHLLYDADANGGEFLHVYSEPVEERFFFEVIQRINGYDQYGAANTPVRLMAQDLYWKRQQERG